MKKFMKFLPLLAVVFLMVGTAQPADAVISYYLGLGNAAISGYAGPYGTVSVTRLTATTAKIEYTSNTVAGNIYLFGDGGSMGLNFNAGSVSAGAVTGSNAGTGFTQGPWSLGGAGNQDGHGSFNFSIDTFDGFTHASDYLSFTATRTDAGSWASDADVLTPNANGHRASAHIFITSAPANSSNGALVTGYAAETGVIPEPGSMLLLGLGLAGAGALGFVRRRRS